MLDLNKVNKLICTLRHYCHSYHEKNKLEKFLQYSSVLCNLQYIINQTYCDDDIENDCIEIANKLKSKEFKDILNSDLPKKEEFDENCVFFYDNFGLDTRGLHLIYLKALCKLNKKIVYITVNSARGHQPSVDAIARVNSNLSVVYIDNISQTDYLKILVENFQKYRPKHAFFYSQPNDVAGTIAFCLYSGLVNRYQVNLTDHAFWLGKCAFDICLEFRNYGATISKKWRKIPLEKLRMLPYYPIINMDEPFAGFPFDPTNKKIIFSGGSIYKTEGEDNKFFKIADSLLEKTNDTVFLFASNQSSLPLENLLKKHPNRAYHISERKDLFQLMRNITVYLNTYPLGGGLMTQYASVAGKIPYALKFDDCNFGLLIGEEKLECIFDDEDSLISDMVKSLEDEQYLKDKELKLKGTVISEDHFNREIENLLSNKDSSFSIIINESLDTKHFRDVYLTRFTFFNLFYKVLVNKNVMNLAVRYPLPFIAKVVRKVIRFIH